jgi:enterochelin esterase-like enzyme
MSAILKTIKHPQKFFILGLLLLTACAGGSGIAALPEACNKSSRVETIRLEETSRGYSYRFLVYLPPCYQAQSEQPYPLLLLIPGRSSSPDDWFSAGVGQALDEAILAGRLPPAIVAVTQNTDSDPHAAVILQDVLPYVQEYFPVSTERRYRAVAGGSLGGIAAYRIVFANPEQFSSAAQFGSGVISGEEPQVKTWLAAMPAALKPRVFLNCGSEDTLMLKRAEAMASLLYENDISHVLHIGPGDHSYTYWVSMFPTYLDWLSEDWQ